MQALSGGTNEGNFFSTTVVTTGDAYYLLGFWNTHRIQTTVGGNQNDGYWNCNGTY